MTTFRWGIWGAARIAGALILATREVGGEVTALAAGKPVLIDYRVNLDYGVNLARVLEALYRSARTGQPLFLVPRTAGADA